MYGVIVPILPFSFEERVGISPDRVQYWVSIALAVFGAALLAGSRKLALRFETSIDLISDGGCNSCLGLLGR